MRPVLFPGAVRHLIQMVEKSGPRRIWSEGHCGTQAENTGVRWVFFPQRFLVKPVNLPLSLDSRLSAIFCLIVARCETKVAWVTSMSQPNTKKTFKAFSPLPPNHSLRKQLIFLHGKETRHGSAGRLGHRDIDVAQMDIHMSYMRVSRTSSPDPNLLP